MLKSWQDLVEILTRPWQDLQRSWQDPDKIKTSYSRFQVTFQSAFPKFVLNIPNYITKFGILCGICKAKFAWLVNEVPNQSTEVLK